MHPLTSETIANFNTNSETTSIDAHNNEISIFRVSNGTVYGWSKGNEIHLTKAGLNPNTPIHEYTHLWAKAMMNKNSKDWNSMKSLLRNTPEWDRVIADDNYKSIRGNEDALASEVLSRISGTENAKRMIAEAQKMIDDNKNNPKAKANAESVLARIKQALNEFWSWVGKNLFDVVFTRSKLLK